MYKRLHFITLACCAMAFYSSVLQADEYKDAKKAYEQGDLKMALNYLIVKLQSESDHQKSIVC